LTFRGSGVILLFVEGEIAMKIVRYQRGPEVAHGLIEEGGVYALAGDLFEGFERGAKVAALAAVNLLAPVQPPKIVAVGVNYRAHAEEMELSLPEVPLLFLKPPSAVIGPGEAIVYPAMSQQVDYEGELAVVVGRRARHIQLDEAPDHVLGYTCANDVTARDLQARDGQWTRAKGFDTFCPLGPWIVPRLDPHDLILRTRVNGELRQESSTCDLIFGVEELVSFISQVMTLEPGDVILTGTPSGIEPLLPGDVVEVEIEGLGVLRNPVVER
jgi:2-keto-4-pentenoate hydratase/2-oxohepta-3-ene-1,7-dioic acid hydratase in catechol pathway